MCNSLNTVTVSNVTINWNTLWSNVILLKRNLKNIIHVKKNGIVNLRPCLCTNIKK